MGPGLLTSASAFLGTPGYMPPEQIVDPTSVDARADIFAVGVILYEILAGLSPIRGANSAETLRRLAGTDAEGAAAVNAGVRGRGLVPAGRPV